MLEVRDLQTAYGRSQVLFGVNLEIQPGQVATLLGRNGMGKTTTVRSIMGIVRPKQGTISFQNASLVGLPSYRIARDRPGPRRPPGISQPHGAREPPRHSRQSPRQEGSVDAG